MAVNLFNEYPQNTQAPNEDYPFGAFRNRTAPTATDGTTLEEKWSNDWQAFFSRLFIEASMTPSGEVDTVKVSQYYDALLAIIQREKVEVSNSLNGTRTEVAASEDALRRTHDLASSKVSKSGDTMTGDLTILNSRPALILRNNTIPANNVGSSSVLHNSAGNTVLSLINEDLSQEFKQVFPRKSGTIALEQDLFGVGQKWVDVTNQRSYGTTYTNDTKKTIFVSVSNVYVDGPGFISVVIDGLEIIRSDKGASGEVAETIFPVASGSTYRLTMTSVYIGAKTWFEFR